MATLDYVATIRPEGYCSTPTTTCPFYRTFAVEGVKPRCTLFNIPILRGEPTWACTTYVRSNTKISLHVEAVP